MSFDLLALELKDALKVQGCAVCHLVRDGDERSMRHFLRERKDEGDKREST